MTVVVKEGFGGLREGCGVCTCAERVLNGCCHVWPVYAAVALGRSWRAEARVDGKKKCVARREWRVMWCSANVCETSREDGKWAAAAGVRWKLVYVYRVGTAAWLGADGEEGGG